MSDTHQPGTFKGFTFKVEALPEDERIEGNCMASGDDAFDRKVAQEIRKDLESNEWAWCCAKVTCRHDASGIMGFAYLGCCSYKSQKDFMEDGYYSDMKEEAHADCLRKIAEMREALEEGG